MFNDLLSRFSKARKIKWPSFLQTKGSTSATLLRKEKKYHIVCTQWVHSLQWIFKSGPKLI